MIRLTLKEFALIVLGFTLAVACLGRMLMAVNPKGFVLEREIVGAILGTTLILISSIIQRKRNKLEKRNKGRVNCRKK